MVKRIGIVRGGNWENYSESLSQGGELISHIFDNLSDKYKPIDIFIDREGAWHIGGIPVHPGDLGHRIDVIWNVSHPSFSNTFDSLSIPNIGTPSFCRAVGDSREILREHMKKIGVQMPRHFIIPAFQKDFDGPQDEFALNKAKEVHEKFGAPWIVKTLVPDLDIGIHVAKTFPEFASAIEDISKKEKSILVEELISGKNAFMHTVSGFRNQDVYVFPAGRFSENEKNNLEDIAKNIHRHIGAEHYLKSNFVLSPKRGIYLTSVEFSPDLKRESHFHKMCEFVGTKVKNVIEHILEKV